MLELMTVSELAKKSNMSHGQCLTALKNMPGLLVKARVKGKMIWHVRVDLLKIYRPLEERVKRLEERMERLENEQD